MFILQTVNCDRSTDGVPTLELLEAMGSVATIETPEHVRAKEAHWLDDEEFKDAFDPFRNDIARRRGFGRLDFTYANNGARWKDSPAPCHH